VPTEKFQQRFPRTLSNLRVAIRELPQALILDSDDLSQPFRKVAEFEHVQMIFRADPLPRCLAGFLE
jgi:hypothetical protein